MKPFINYCGDDCPYYWETDIDTSGCLIFGENLDEDIDGEAGCGFTKKQLHKIYKKNKKEKQNDI